MSKIFIVELIIFSFKIINVGYIDYQMSIKEKFLYNNLSDKPTFSEKNLKVTKENLKKHNYISKILKIKYPSQEFKLKNSKRHSIAQMASPPLALNFYKFLCGLKKPKRILEIGSFIGYSTLFGKKHQPRL